MTTQGAQRRLPNRPRTLFLGVEHITRTGGAGVLPAEGAEGKLNGELRLDLTLSAEPLR
jgi:hypothetical protein